MRTILYVFAAVSAFGLVLSVASHSAALLGSQGPLGDRTPILHVGIFVLALPTALVAYPLTKNASARDFWKAALRGCPEWMRYMTYGFFWYAVLNFVLFVIVAPKQGGTGPMPPRVVRGFSGHWMFFYRGGSDVSRTAL